MNLNEIFENYRQAPSERNLSEVIKKSQNLIYSIALNIVKHNQDAEDVTQEVLIKVIQNSNILPKDVNFIAWLNKVSMNASINFYHQKKRSKALLGDFQEEQLNTPPSKEDETISIVYQHLSKLEETEQSMIINKHIHQMTFAQLSNLYNMPIPTIQSKINNILSKVKLSIEKAGFAGVALALSSILDELKAATVTLDLLPNVKEHFPTTYPKPKFSSKIFSKPIMVAIGALSIFFIYGGITYINHQNNTLKQEISNKEAFTKADNQKNQNFAGTKNNQNYPTEVKSNPETTNAEQKITPNPVPQANEGKSSISKNEYAGQLLDKATKEPIADAKLEIWDIYTYQKIETTTDIEGKYEIPKDLDKTFFYFLKFLKEDYVVKQTFQHFNIESKPIIYMNKNKKIDCKVWFEKKSKGVIYLGSYLNLNSDQHLSSNQKQNLLIVFSCMLENAPLEVYTYRKVEFENVSNFIINELVLDTPSPDFQSSNRDFPFYNFGLWYEESQFKGTYGMVEGGASSSFDHSSNHYKLKFKKSGKPVTVKDLKIFDKHTKKESEKNKENKEPDEFNGPLWNCLISYKENDYFCELGSADFGLKEGQFATMLLVPYSNILFEPLSLSAKYNNSQAIVGNNLYSKKSIFKKINYANELNIYDNFFEELQLSTEIKIPLGGILDINHELNTSLCKNISILITVNNNPLKNNLIKISMTESDKFDTYSEHSLYLDSNGKIVKMIPLKMKKLKITFTSNKIAYSKIIDLNQIVNDQISLNYDKPLKVQISKDVLASFTSADQKDLAFFKYKRDPSYLYLSNESSSIKTPFSELTLYLENNLEYTLTDSGNSIKTNFNQLKCFKPELIKPDLNNVELKPMPESDYTLVKVFITDASGNTIQKASWVIIEDCISKEQNINYIYKHNTFYTPIEFYSMNNQIFEGKDKKLAEDFTIGDETLKNDTVQLLNNRKYLLCVSAEGYVNSINSFSTSDGQIITKTIILNKTNSVKYKGETTSEFSEITKILKKDDIIYEYNKIRIIDKEAFYNSQEECNQESVSIKLIRNNTPISLMIPAIQIFEIEDYSYDDKNGILKNDSPAKTPQ